MKGNVGLEASLTGGGEVNVLVPWVIAEKIRDGGIDVYWDAKAGVCSILITAKQYAEIQEV